MAPRIWRRICRVTVDSLAVEQLRVGFTIEQSLAKETNRSEVSIYNLAESSRNAMHKADAKAKVVVEAGYEETGLSLIFAGEMRAAYSRPDSDGATWITVLRAGDGDKGARRTRKKAKTSGVRPGVSLDRVMSDLASRMGVGIGNVGAELRKGNLSFEGLGQAFARGLNYSGSEYELMQKLARSAGHELSIQGNEFQLIKRGGVLSVQATVLNRDSGLEGSPEIDTKGIMSFRARILPGLECGYPVQIESLTSYGTGLWRIEKRRVIGDTREQDWVVEGKGREIR
jgi:hypothetical protein